LKQKPKDGEETELELKVDEDDDIIDLMLDDEPLERKILLFKKNPLETQILAKVLINIGYEVDVVSSMDELEGKISDRSYDILFIDVELVDYSILKRKHENMSIILMSLKDIDSSSYDSSVIKEVLVGVMQTDKLKQIISKYR